MGKRTLGLPIYTFCMEKGLWHTVRRAPSRGMIRVCRETDKRGVACERMAGMAALRG